MIRDSRDLESMNTGTEQSISTAPYWGLYNTQEIYGTDEFYGYFATEELAKQAQTYAHHTLNKYYNIRYFPPQVLETSLNSWVERRQLEEYKRVRAKLTEEEYKCLMRGTR